MRYPASEKLEIIRIVEQSHLPAKRTLDQLGIARRTFYRWYDRYLEGGPEALEDRPSAPSRVWNRIGDDIRDQIVEMALETTELSPRELAVRFTDERRYFVSEATVSASQAITVTREMPGTFRARWVAKSAVSRRLRRPASA